MKLQQLPNDILGYIVEFINPMCSQKRIGFICDVISPCLPYLVQFFYNKKTDCDFDDHIYLNGHTICIFNIERFDSDEQVHRRYFHSILKHIILDLQSTKRVTKYNPSTAYTYHFPDELVFDEQHALVQFIIHKVFKNSLYRYSHMCCSGKGLFANSIYYDFNL